MNRTMRRRVECIARNPAAQIFVNEVATAAFADFVRRAFINRPDDFTPDEWGQVVEMVLRAGKLEPQPTPEQAPGFEIKELPPKKEKAARKRTKKTDGTPAQV